MTDIVHIGYHKTATNWFQRLFYPGAQGLRYVHRKHVRAAFIHHDAFHFDPATARATLGKRDDEDIILCEEELSGNLHNGGLFGCLSKEVAQRIHRTLPGARIVIFIRNQPAMIASVYKQYVKEGGTHGVNRYLHHAHYLHESGFQPAKAPLFRFEHFEYLPLIRHYQALFGRERVHVFPYEAFARDGEAFVTRFADALGLDVPPQPLHADRVNIGYRRGTLALARLINHFTYRDVVDKRVWLNVPFTYRKGRILLKHLNRLPVLGRQQRPGDLLGRDNMEFIQAYYAHVNAQLEAELGIRLAEFGYPLPTPSTRS
ncbi:hypothetical protein KBTX_03381 [wastewater metagenome]|uniref:Sulfotransferase domain-containing protein n=2 Tax=unclassified sequences TaxID=12908 RepID=A0A5B8RJJ6_9ZZZZ|nr:hypothetical protein [Arhodomonas sp. KWT]QEA07037.1 hypothetical protein KBTEX_03381 [uncultured organism]